MQADYSTIDFLPGFAVALPVKGFGEANPRGDPQGHFGAVYQAWNVKSRRARGTKQLQSCRAWDGTSAVLSARKFQMVHRSPHYPLAPQLC